MCAKIDEVTPESLRKVAYRIFGPQITKQPTIIAMGHEDVGDWKAVLKKYGVGGQ
jgi:processing peptidase subunit alpha